MPIPVALAGPALLGPGLAVPGAVGAGTALGAMGKAAIYMSESAAALGGLTSASFAIVLARLAYKRLPNWFKDDISLQSLLPFNNNNNDRTETEEMERLSSVIEKLQCLIAKGAEKLDGGSNSLTASSFNAALLAYIQLSVQMKQDNAKDRDEMYNTNNLSGCAGVVTKKEIEKMKEALDQSMWAYYIDDQDIVEQMMEDTDYVLLHTAIAKSPGHVGHYVALSTKRKEVLIGIKGTSSLEDFFTDCCGRAVPYRDHGTPNKGIINNTSIEVCAEFHDQMLYRDQKEEENKSSSNLEYCVNDEVEIANGHERIIMIDRENHQIHSSDGNDDPQHVSCHEGILLAACRVADIVQPIVEAYVTKNNNNEEHNNETYTLKIVGHSLGGGAAAMLAVVLRDRIPELDCSPPLPKNDGGQRYSNTDNSKPKMSVVAFAPPPVLDHDTCIGAISSLDCISVVNNSDIIPRSSLGNIITFLNVLKRIHYRLEALNMAPSMGLQQASSFIQNLLQQNSNPILSYDRLQTIVREAQNEIRLNDPDYLYIPGRVYFIHKPWGVEGEKKETASSKTKNNEIYIREDENRSDIEQQWKNNDAAAFTNSISTLEMVDLAPSAHCNITDGLHPALRFFEIDSHNMFSDHSSLSYHTNIERLVSAMAKISSS